MTFGKRARVPPSRILLEICTGSVTDALAAWAAGADRIELNTALETGGLTPSPGMTEALLSRIRIPVIIMLRPVTGGFCYDETHFQAMLRDTEWIRSSGAKGVALGILDEKGLVDIPRCRQLIRRLDGMETVFHRAFDAVPDPYEALEMLADLGFSRILTSGQGITAAEGTETIANLVGKSRGRLEILPGGGIRPANVLSLLRQTGCNQVHASLSAESTSAPGADRGNIRQDTSPNPWDRHRTIDTDLVRQMREILAAPGIRA